MPSFQKQASAQAFLLTWIRQ